MCNEASAPQSTPAGESSVEPLSRNAWSSALCSVNRARPHPRAKRAKPPPQNRPTCRGSYDSGQALGTLLCLCLLIVIQLIAQNKSIADPDNPTPPDDARFVGHAAVRHPFENGPLICAQLSRGPASQRPPSLTDTTVRTGPRALLDPPPTSSVSTTHLSPPWVSAAHHAVEVRQSLPFSRRVFG